MVIIIDYEMGNVRSVFKAFQAIGAEVDISNQPEAITAASHLVLPGVGAFSEGMQNLRRLALLDLLQDQVVVKGKPFLGICLGMQLLATEGFEDGQHQGLGWIPGKVDRLDTQSGQLKLPHIGWNEICYREGNPLFQGLGMNPTFYFVHSYQLQCDPAVVSATCNYGQDFTAAIQQDNIYGTQFHPEKSQKNGLQVLRNFLISFKTD